MKQSLSFRGPTGLPLVGNLVLPDGNARCSAVVFAHDLHRHRKEDQYLALAERLRERGIASLLFDSSGRSESKSNLKGVTVEQLANNLSAAINRLEAENRVDLDRVGIVGWGAGGTAAILCSAVDKRVSALVLLNVEVGALPVLEAAYCIDVPTLLIASELDPVAVHEMHAIQFSLRGETYAEVVEGANAQLEGPGQLKKIVDLSADWFAEKLNVLTRA